MRVSALAVWVGRSLRRELGRSVLAVASTGVGVGTVVFFMALGLGTTRLVRERLFPAEAAAIEVVPPAVSLTLLGERRLDDRAVERLAALPSVSRVQRKLMVRVPVSCRYAGDFFGVPIRLAVELSAVGVDSGLLSADVPPTRFVDRGTEEPLPAVPARRLIDLYNRAFAPQRKLPQLTAAMLEGFSFPVEFNRSWLTPAGGTSLPATLELVGFSDRVPIASLAIPLEAARRINRAGGVDAEAYSSVVLEVDKPEALPRVAEQVRGMGWGIDDTERRLGETVASVLLLTTAALALLGLVVCGLAAVNIAYARAAAVETRKRELAVMRAVGARRGEVQAVILVHGATIGIAGAALGAAGAFAAAMLIQRFAAEALPTLLAGAPLFRWPAWVWVGALLLGAGAALLGAFLPSRRAARVDPAQTLAAVW